MDVILMIINHISIPLYLFRTEKVFEVMEPSIIIVVVFIIL